MSDYMAVARGCAVCHGPVRVEQDGTVRCAKCDPHPDPQERNKEQEERQWTVARRKPIDRYGRF